MARGADVIRASIQAERMAGHLYARLAAVETGKAGRLPGFVCVSRPGSSGASGPGACSPSCRP